MNLRSAPASSTHSDTESAPAVLDPCHLGRPMHMLTQFNALLHEDLSMALRRQLGRRRDPALQIGDVRLQRMSGALRAARWLQYPTERGRIGFHADRTVLLTLLACRYGGDAPGQPVTPGEMPPETATEERLLQSLGQTLVRTALARIDVGLRESPSGTTRTPLPGGQPAPPPIGAWLLKASVRGAGDAHVGHLLFSLDESCMDTLLTHLSPPRNGLASAPTPVDLADTLRLTLRARLVQQQLPLGQILDLRPGDVIPIRLATTDVLIRESVLFRATVAEHQGKLCLTSFTDD